MLLHTLALCGLARVRPIKLVYEQLMWDEWQQKFQLCSMSLHVILQVRMLEYYQEKITTDWWTKKIHIIHHTLSNALHCYMTKAYHQWDSVTCFRWWNNNRWQNATKHYSNWICCKKTHTHTKARRWPHFYSRDSMQQITNDSIIWWEHRTRIWLTIKTKQNRHTWVTEHWYNNGQIGTAASVYRCHPKPSYHFWEFSSIRGVSMYWVYNWW